MVFVQGALAVTITYNDNGGIASGPSNTVDVALLKVGGPNQDRVNNVDVRVTFKNKGNETITITSIRSSLESRFGFEDFSGNVNITPGSTHTFTLRTDIPKDFDAVDEDGKESSIKIGTLDYRGTVGSDSLHVQTPAFMQAVNHLKEDTVRVYVNGEFNSVEDGDEIKDISPGDEIRIEVGVRNDFAREDEAGQGSGTIHDLTIKDVELHVEIDHDDFDVDEDVDIGDLDPQVEDKDGIKFDLSPDLSTVSMPLMIKVTGEDELGALHGFFLKVLLQVAKQSHDLSFQEIKVEPRKVQCDRNVKMSFNLANIGKSNEEKGKMILESTTLKLQQVVENISIKEGRSQPFTLNFTVSPLLSQGTYVVTLKSFFNEKYQVDQRNIDLEVVNCDGTATVEEELTPSEDENTLPPPRVVTEQPPVPVIENKTELLPEPSKLEPYKDLLIWGSIIIGVLIIILIIILILIKKYG